MDGARQSRIVPRSKEHGRRAAADRTRGHPRQSDSINAPMARARRRARHPMGVSRQGAIHFLRATAPGNHSEFQKLLSRRNRAGEARHWFHSLRLSRKPPSRISKSMSTELFQRTIAADYGDPERNELMKTEWAPTPWML